MILLNVIINGLKNENFEIFSSILLNDDFISSSSEVSSKLLILSDMQFDQACQQGDKFLTGYEFIESKYKRYKLPMPHIIFWNLRTKLSVKQTFSIQRN